MDKQAAVKLIKDTFERPFDKVRFINLSKNLFKHLDMSNNFLWAGNRLPNAGAFQPHINSIERIGKSDEQSKSEDQLDVLIVNLKKETSLERARTKQRNFVARYLEDKQRKAALVAFVPPEPANWRFSLVRMDYNTAGPPGGKVKVETELTPARRYSFLVGENESSHTAQVQLLPILVDDERKPLLSDFERAFNIEVVTKEFFTKYHDLFNDVKEALEGVVKQSLKVREDFEAKGIDPVNFAKKLLGQIVFLYFLQKKGWFGVGRDEDWGTGPRDFLRRLFEKEIVSYQNFFNDVLEPLFYEALAVERTADFYSRFNCKIPFLNGGLFDPINSYDWVHTDILLPNELFSNQEKTKEGDTGTGILDVFDRYNFTVKEDEPLDKEVAVDPEMLGKVFENLLEVKDRKSKGTYYTPREIVHYMCQESLISYLDTALNTGEVALVAEKPVNLKLFGAPAVQQQALKAPGYTNRVPREDIEVFVRMGELAIEHDLTALRNLDRIEQGIQKTTKYQLKLRSIQENASIIDEALANIRVCDPAIGSGAFPVGLMTEIVRARNTLSTYLPDETGRTNYHFKRHAIQSCLYGVDIDPGAVEIAKLRLWLSLVVDEEDIKQIQPLPNLDYKIICGNSLLGVKRDVLNWPVFEELEKLKQCYFSETNTKKKQEFTNQIDLLIKKLTNNNETFDFEVYFSEVFRDKKLDKKWQAYHITWVTHNSRVSERMVELEVRAGEPVVLSDEWQGKITEEIRNIVREDGLRVLAYNILSDHVHMVLVCQEDELSNIVRKLKGRSSQKLKEYLGIPAEEVFHLWAQKFNTSYIDSEDKLRNAIAYVTSNREKHALSDTGPGHSTDMASDMTMDTPTDMNKGWPPLVQSTTSPLIREMLTPLEHAFDPVYEKGGFDIAIANPPYDVVNDDKLRELYRESIYGRANLYGLFIHRVVDDILRNQGTLAFINPKTLLADAYFTNLRKYLKRNGDFLEIMKIVDRHTIFDEVLQACIIMLFRKRRPLVDHHIRVREIEQRRDISSLASSLTIHKDRVYQSDQFDGCLFCSNKKEAYSAWQKVCAVSKPLSHFGLSFTTGKIQWDLYKKYLVEKPVPGAVRLIWAENIQHYAFKPSVKRAGQEYIKKPGIHPGITQNTIVTQRTTADEQDYRIIATLFSPSESGFNGLSENHTNYLETAPAPVQLKYLLACLNSRLYDFMFRHISSNTQVSSGQLNSLPLADISAPRQQAFITLVDRIFAITKDEDYFENETKQAKVKELERQIDQLVYQLYGLTQEEIAVVEGKK